MKVLTSLLGGDAAVFSGPSWPDDVTLFHADGEWFRNLSSLPVLRDPEKWLEQSPLMLTFATQNPLSRAEARRRHRDGESIYILGLDQADKTLRELCDGLAADLYVNPSSVTVEAWAAGRATSVALHYDLDHNFNIQVCGEKEWQTAPNDVLKNPVSSFHPTRSAAHLAIESGRELPTDMPADARTFQVAPGDVVYLPRGAWHATRTSDATFSLAFVIRPPTWAQHLVAALVDRLHNEARWRERVIGGRALSRHGELRATAVDALAAAKNVLDRMGPSELLYEGLWGKKPAFFKRAEGVACRFDETSGTLTCQRGDERRDIEFPDWARRAAEYIAKQTGVWSMAALHDQVDAGDAPFLNAFVTRLTDAGFVTRVPAASGGLAPVQTPLNKPR
jgi:hypothetical protein